MKKALFFIVSIVMMVCAVSSLTSCQKDETTIVMSAAGIFTPSPNISVETKNAIDAAENRINARIDEILGNKFNVKCDEQGNIDDATKTKYSERIINDSKILSILKEAAELKDNDGKTAIYYITFYFYSGTTIMWKFDID